MGEDLSAKLQTWLRKSSAPMEYRVAEILARQGFAVAQGRGYQVAGPSGAVTREVDVLATESSKRAALVVECKHSDAHPWVVLTNAEPLSSEDTLRSSVSRTLARLSLVDALERSQGKGLPPFLGEHEHPGFSVIVADDLGGRPLEDGADSRKGESRNRARDAMAQAVSAAYGVLDSAMPDWQMSWPAVVISGPLFEVRYADGESQILPAAWKRVMWHTSPFGESVVLDVVTLAHFESAYAASAWDGLRSVAQRLKWSDEEARRAYSADMNENL